MIEGMMIGQLAARSGLPVRTLRFYADAGVLPEAGRTEGGYRLFGPGAVAQARLIRTLRELGVGLDDIKRVLTAEAALADVAAEHARAIEAQIRVLRLRRALLQAFIRSSDPGELQRMTDLTALTAGERRRIVEDYLDAVWPPLGRSGWRSSRKSDGLGPCRWPESARWIGLFVLQASPGGGGKQAHDMRDALPALRPYKGPAGQPPK